MLLTLGSKLAFNFIYTIHEGPDNFTHPDKISMCPGKKYFYEPHRVTHILPISQSRTTCIHHCACTTSLLSFTCYFLLQIAEGWFAGICPTATDLSVALSVIPEDRDGFYVGEIDGEIVASLIRIPMTDDGIYYGSYFYVHDKCR